MKFAGYLLLVIGLSSWMATVNAEEAPTAEPMNNDAECYREGNEAWFNRQLTLMRIGEEGAANEIIKSCQDKEYFEHGILKFSCKQLFVVE